MKNPLARRGAVGLALAALVLGGTALAPAPARAALDSPTIGSGVSYYLSGGACTKAGAAASPARVPFADNDRTVTQRFSSSGTYTANANTADVVGVAASGTASVRATPFRGGPTTISGSASATAAVTDRGAAGSVCAPQASASPGAATRLVLSRPMWVTLSASGNGTGSGFVSAAPRQGETVGVVVTSRSSGSVTALLPAGEIEVNFEAAASAGLATPRSSYGASFRAHLLPIGYASAVRGRAARLVRLGSRDCVAQRVGVRLTSRAKKARSVVLRVNGKRVALYRGKRLKSRSVAVRVASASKATLTATVTLKSGRKVTVSRSYLACS